MNYFKIVNSGRLKFMIWIGCLTMACQPNVLFHEAVPPNVEAIYKVPSFFQGVFMCESDSSLMYAQENVIYNESYRMFVTPLKRVIEKEECSIVAGELYVAGNQECIPFEYLSEDTIQAKVYSRDTLFSFRESEVMKLYKGRLFMNYKNKRNEWVTYMITPLANRNMNWELIDVPDKINEIESITHDYTTRNYKQDETLFILKPTLVEFDRILSRQYTSSCDVLIPINLEF